MLRVTKLTSWARAWSDRVLLTPVLSGLAKPFQLLWAALAFIGLRIWRWLLRPVWRWALRPIWSLLRLVGAFVLASPWIVARTFPNRGWLTSAAVLALTAVVLLVPGVVNAKTQDRLSRVTTATSQTLGTIRPEITVSLASFAGWGLEPFDDQHRELVLKQNGDELRIIREDHVPNAEDFLRKYANVKLGVRDRVNLYPMPTTVNDAHGKPVRVLQIEQSYRVTDLPRRNWTYQAMLYNYGTTVLLLVLSTSGFAQQTSGAEEDLWGQWRALQASVRITP